MTLSVSGWHYGHGFSGGVDILEVPLVYSRPSVLCKRFGIVGVVVSDKQFALQSRRSLTGTAAQQSCARPDAKEQS
jgi:hypothetical protein